MRCRSRRSRVCFTAVVAAAAVIAGLQPLRSEVIYEERTERFEIGVREETPAAVWAALNRYGPLVDGRGAIGAAKASIRWYDIKIRRTAQGCMVDSAKVHVGVKLILPEWERAWRVTPDMQSYWACVERTVTTHEQRHAEIWRETGERIDRGLRALSTPMACDELNVRIGETANRLYREGARRQLEFDEADRARPRYQMCESQRSRNMISADRPSPHVAIVRSPPAAGASGKDRGADGGLVSALINLAIAALVLLAAAAAYAATMGLAIRFAASNDETGADDRQLPPPT